MAIDAVPVVNWLVRGQGGMSNMILAAAKEGQIPSKACWELLIIERDKLSEAIEIWRKEFER